MLLSSMDSLEIVLKIRESVELRASRPDLNFSFSFTSCVTLGKSPNLYGPPFLHTLNGNYHEIRELM